VTGDIQTLGHFIYWNGTKIAPTEATLYDLEPLEHRSWVRILLIMSVFSCVVLPCISMDKSNTLLSLLESSYQN